MEEMKKMICITCPKGCTLEVTRDGETITKVVAGCKRGNEYAEREMRDPRRMVASTVKIANSLHPLMPVYTSAPFPKPRIHELLLELRQMELRAPIRVGQVDRPQCAGYRDRYPGQPICRAPHRRSENDRVI